MNPKTEYKEFSIVFIPTWACNCTCDHCFEKIMPRTIRDEDWETYFSKLRNMIETDGIRKLMIYWQGGEVMSMNPAKIRKGLEIGVDIFRDCDCLIEHHLQTNLLLYNQDWREVISDFFSGSISSSLDFPNLYRETPSVNRKEYTGVWLKKKEEVEKDGFTVSVVTLPNTETLEMGAERFYSFFRDEVDIRNLQINFPFPGVNVDTPTPMNSGKLADFMEDLYNIWIASDRHLNLNPFAPLENRIHKNHGRLSCAFSYNCANFILAVGPDGEAGQCDCWISTQKEYSFGSFSSMSVNEILDSEKRKLFLLRPVEMIQGSECGTCAYWSICYGGCPIRAYTFTGDIYSKDYYCEVYKRLFRMVIERGKYPHYVST
ncbi:MAG: radical SAM protein [Thermodesulfovibrionia bacterium]|nr:radical SAM protein [Thermodesulfovibrionia bacterium]